MMLNVSGLHVLPTIRQTVMATSEKGSNRPNDLVLISTGWIALERISARSLKELFFFPSSYYCSNAVTIAWPQTQKLLAHKQELY